MMFATDIAQRLNLHKSNGEWRGACPACGYATSFVLSVKNGRTLGWCSSCQDKEVIAEVLAGKSAGKVFRSADDETNAAVLAAEKTARALKLWNGSSPAAGTAAECYMAARGLPDLALSGALRFRGDCWHPNGGRLPAMIALVTDAAGTGVAVHRTYLRRDGSAKAAVEPAKASLGPVRRGAVRLAPVAAELVIGEGIETAASAGLILGLPAWSAVSAGNMAKALVLPPEVKSVVIAADPDEPGERAAREAALRWGREGRKVRIARPNVAGRDFNDLLRGVRHG